MKILTRKDYMKKIAIYESYKTEKEYSLLNIEQIYNVKNGEYLYYVDEIKSRLDKNRPNLERLKKDIESGKIEQIIIKSLQQISRDTFYNLDFISFVEENNCKIICLDGSDVHQYKYITEGIIERQNREELER